MLGVFLSSTFQDFDEYRTEVSEALEEDASVRAARLENAAGAYVDTVALCSQEFQASDAFLLLLAHWYGSIPPPGPKSITHLEFEWAWDRWKNHSRRPMAVLMPQDGSPADLELRQKAAALLSNTAETYQQQHPKLMDDFRRQVTGNWQRVMYFPTRERAARKALVAYFHWQDQTPMRAATGPKPAVAAGEAELRSDSALGTLGREEQMGALKLEISRLKLRPETPGAAFLVSGDELAGQAQFLENVVRSSLCPGRPAQAEFLPSSAFPADKLPGWISDYLGFTGSERAETIPDLAATLAAELNKQSLSVVIGTLEPVMGGVQAFQQQFWLPLYEALADLKKVRGIKNRLFAIAAEYDATPGEWRDAIYRHDPAKAPPGYTRMVLLPRLGKITEDHLAQWLEAYEVAEVQRPGLVREVMKNKSSVQACLAFDRLKRQSFQFEGRETD